MVFCRTKRTAQKTAEDLMERGFKAAPIHGDLGQSAREKALSDFKAGKPLLVHVHQLAKFEQAFQSCLKRAHAKHVA